MPLTLRLIASLSVGLGYSIHTGIDLKIARMHVICMSLELRETRRLIGDATPNTMPCQMSFPRKFADHVSEKENLLKVV